MTKVRCSHLFTLYSRDPWHFLYFIALVLCPLGRSIPSLSQAKLKGSPNQPLLKIHHSFLSWQFTVRRLALPAQLGAMNFSKILSIPCHVLTTSTHKHMNPRSRCAGEANKVFSENGLSPFLCLVQFPVSPTEF